ncbi:Hypothetical predicted protein [Octopus vulgaris]|uniref:Uncharacterized protein n=1 Tax=Octopus vulgaris TaxID=6645 RepID=A0AA36BD67_OCTVU|nr:Hypothetical predicted protein [Octopus vulgaris]
MDWLMELRKEEGLSKKFHSPLPQLDLLSYHNPLQNGEAGVLKWPSSCKMICQTPQSAIYHYPIYGNICNNKSRKNGFKTMKKCKEILFMFKIFNKIMKPKFLIRISEKLYLCKD